MPNGARRDGAWRERFDRERLAPGEQVAAHASADYVPTEYQFDIRTLDQEVADLAHEVCAAILIECNVFYIGKPQPGLTQTVGNGSGGNSPMLHAAESFLPGGSDQLAILH